jgi:hypothetical protein
VNTFNSFVYLCQPNIYSFSISVLTLFLIACDPAKVKTSQAGVYQLDKLIINDGKKDTTYTGVKEIKIYTGTHFAYVNYGTDSTVGFGVGSYNGEGDKITETSIYNSTSLDTAATFQLAIATTEKGYKQTIADMPTRMGKINMVEEYQTIPSTGATEMDGAWKAISAYTIKGKDTIQQKATQFKFYQGGHFLFVHRYATDSTNTKFMTGFGFGKFTAGKEMVEEEIVHSNYPSIAGKKFTLKIVMNGKDAFSQTIKDSTGSSVENYQRLK